MKPWLIFDLDDTLIPSSHIYSVVAQKMKLKIDFKNARTRAKARQVPHHTSNHHRLIYFKCFLEIKNQMSADGALKLMTQYERLMTKEVKFWVSKSKLKLELQVLKKKYRLAIFTNETLRTQLIKLREIDPQGQLFDQILTSEEIGQEKKASGSFKKLLKILKAKPTQCTMVGDDYIQDIVPARRAGIKRVIQIKAPKAPAAWYKLSTRAPELFL